MVVAIGLMVAALLAVKFAGKNVSPPGAISPARIVIVPLLADTTVETRRFADSTVARLAELLAAAPGLTPVLMTNRPPGLENIAVRRQIRLNYRAGTMLSGQVLRTEQGYELALRLTDTATDSALWTLPPTRVEPDSGLKPVVAAIVAKIPLPNPGN